MTKQCLATMLMLAGFAGVSRVAEAADGTAPVAIEATNGIVYVKEGTCGHRVRACLTHVTAGGHFRFLRVRVETRVLDKALMVLIGHELRHAIEVLGNATLTSTPAMQQFYRRHGSKGLGWAYETTAAIQAGYTVEAELRRYRRSKEAKD